MIFKKRVAPDFDYRIKDGILFMVDLDAGSISLTNGMETALQIVSSAGKKFDRVLYRDSDKNWSEVLFERVGNVDNFDITFKPISNDKDRYLINQTAWR
jgi:hypothetical protein